MKSSPLLLQLAAISSAFVLPNQDVFAEVQIESSRSTESILAKVPSANDVFDASDSKIDHITEQVHDAFRKYGRKAHQSLDEALAVVSEEATSTSQMLSDSYFDAQSWLDAEVEDITTSDPLSLFKCSGSYEISSKSKDTRTNKDHHGHKGNETVYQLISKSKYTTKFTKLLDDFPDLVDTLNNTEGHYTVFAPTDAAFEDIPEDAPKPSREFIEKLLSYHISPKFYPAGRVLVTRTIPTLLKNDQLAKEPVSQRLGTQITLRGLVVNYYSRIVAVDIFGSNGVIHGVDALIVPRPPVLKLVDLLPEEFSTLELGLFKTGLFQVINETAHTGGTLFAPGNFAFQKLGARVNAFLFSPPGLKYLKALLEYHGVANQTLYSDYYIDGRSSSEESFLSGGHGDRGPPRGYQHFDLETGLEGKSLAIDISRYGRLIDIRINGYTHVIRPDGVASDGVLHEINNVLIPPHRHHHGGDDDADGMWDGKTEMSIEELKERLEPLAKESSIPEEL